MRHVFLMLLWIFPLFGSLFGADLVTSAKNQSSAVRVHHVVVIPIHDQIDQPTLFVLRRGLKEAIARQDDVVVLDINTPGGSAASAFAMMEAIEKFGGTSIAFVDAEAASAGAFIAASTDEIWFTPHGVIGAAAAVTSDGQDIPETMRLKMNSFLRGKIRAISAGKGFRGQVISAMIDKDYELKIGDKVLKKPGELLTLTADEAMTLYGNPPLPLLGAGIAPDLEALLSAKYGTGNYTVTRLTVNWAEVVAQYLTSLSPVLLGLGMLALFIEFKTPGFGVFGILGLLLLGIVFVSGFVAGLSGHEPILFFALGLVLLIIEVIFFPGVMAVALTGLVLMVVSLLWSMTDVWPNQPFAFSQDGLLLPLEKLFLGLSITAIGLAAIWRFLPYGWFWQRIAVHGAVVGNGFGAANPEDINPLIGREGIAVTGLFPSGQVEIDGTFYETRLEVGFAVPGTRVQVVRRTQFGLIVEVSQ